jgi:hypothetical protein
VRALAEVAIALGLMVINGFLAVPGFAMMSSRRGGRPDSPAAAIGAGVAVRRLGDPTTFLSIVQVPPRWSASSPGRPAGPPWAPILRAR